MSTLDLGIPDEAFWSDPAPTLEAAVDKAREADFLGLRLEGPRAVDLRRRETLPLLGLRRAGFEEAFRLRLETRAVLVAVSRSDNSVRAALAFEDKSEEAEDTTPPADGFPEGTGINPFALEARERLPGLPWVPGTYDFSLLLFDQASNTVTVTLRKEGLSADESAAFPPPAHPAQVHPVPDTADGHGFGRAPGSPDLPAQEGIRIVIDPKAEVAGAPACLVRASFRLPARAGELLKERPPIAGAEGAAALLPITLLVIGKDVPGPFLFTVQVPAHASVEAGLVEGWFTVNLLRMSVPFGIPQEYVARAVHGRAQSEPVRFANPKGAARK